MSLRISLLLQLAGVFLLTLIDEATVEAKEDISTNDLIVQADNIPFQTIALFIMAILLIILIIINLKLRNTSARKIREAFVELRHITNSIHAGFVNFVLGDNFEITYASNGYYDIIGFDKKAMKRDLNNSFISLVTQEDYNKIKLLCEEFSNGEYIQLEVRILTKNRNIIWVLVNGNYIKDKEGRHTLSAVIVDITDSRNMQERIVLEEERYRVAAEISNDILFEYEISADKMIFADKYNELYGRHPIILDFIKDEENAVDMIHPEDYGNFCEFCRALSSGKEMIEAEFRIKDISGEFVWCHIRGKTLYNELKKPYRVIGKVVNIDLHKKELQTLEYKAKRDSLTGVYNKSTTKDLIDHYILRHNDLKHIFMIIDIDDFKSINDTYGHLQGDKILSYVIGQVKMIFTTGEIIGRIGGDEFAVFIGNISSREAIIMKAELLKRALHTVYTDEGYEISLSGSIGVSMYPEDGTTYNQLLSCADKALYLVKDEGKDGFKLFT
jgi:diguanylate cyclase (GGDEF)-like protein/PAS domain S-box-containing protein